MKKRKFKLFGIITLMALIAFTMAGCGGDGNDPNPQKVTYTSTSGETTFVLTITDNTSYVLTVTLPNGDVKTSQGTAVKEDGDSWVFIADAGGEAFTVTISAGGMGSIDGTITFSDGDDLEGPGTVTPKPPDNNTGTTKRKLNISGLSDYVGGDISIILNKTKTITYDNFGITPWEAQSGILPSFTSDPLKDIVLYVFDMDAYISIDKENQTPWGGSGNYYIYIEIWDPNYSEANYRLFESKSTWLFGDEPVDVQFTASNFEQVYTNIEDDNTGETASIKVVNNSDETLVKAVLWNISLDDFIAMMEEFESEDDFPPPIWEKPLNMPQGSEPQTVTGAPANALSVGIYNSTKIHAIADVTIEAGKTTTVTANSEYPFVESGDPVL